MAVQLNTEELQGCKSYLGWLIGKIRKEDTSEELCRVLFETDFVYEMDEDEIRARDALDLRTYYAEEEGRGEGKSKRDTDRIWKSIHGKCSVLELLVSLCRHLDLMLNEGDEGEMMPKFFGIFIRNLGLDGIDDEDFDHREKSTKAFWKEKIGRFIDRKYDFNGGNGGLFPLKETEKDQRKVSIWYQMNAWLEEHLDEEEQFVE